jgi:hypothetical protein
VDLNNYIVHNGIGKVPRKRWDEYGETVKHQTGHHYAARVRRSARMAQK